MSRKFTSQQMRDMALVEESYGWYVVAKMLRQAADMMERADSAIRANAKEKVYRHKDADAVLETAEFIIGGKLTRDKDCEKSHIEDSPSCGGKCTEGAEE